MLEEKSQRTKEHIKVKADVAELLYGAADDGRTLTVKVESLKTKIDKAYTQKIADYKRKNNLDPNTVIEEKLLKQFKTEAAEDVKQNSSLDLLNMLGAYSSALVTFHHKVKIEEPLRLAEAVFTKQIKEVRLNAAGKPVRRRIEGVETVETIPNGLQNYREMIANTLDRYFNIPIVFTKVVV